MSSVHDGDELRLFGSDDPARGIARTDRLVRVVPDRGIEGPDAGGGLLYSAGELDLAVGDRVEVPLGKGARLTRGVVVAKGGVELLGGLAAARLRTVQRRMEARLSPDLLGLAQWMAGYYVTPLGMVIASMVPAAVNRQTGRRTEVLYEPGTPAAAEAGAAPPLSPLPPPPTTAATRKLLEKLALIEPGAFPMEGAALAARLGVKTTGPIRRLAQAGHLRTTSRGVIESQALPGAGAGAGSAARSTPPVPTRDQARAIEGIGAELGAFGVHLIRGVTGSGKTEVYLRLLARVLDAGKGAIVLVPEISLTPQTSARFTGRFGDEVVAVLHSGLTASQRHREWDRAARGAARVVVGARSAIFAPISGLGLIVVDEEHDSSYKQDQLPRYSARDVAIMRGQGAGCPVVLGSATPSLESYYNAWRGKSKVWHLDERAGGGALPRVEVVDLGRDLAQDSALRAAGAAEQAATGVGHDAGELKGLAAGFGSGMRSIGPTLRRAMSATLSTGGQVILLLNRRGYASYIGCANRRCGWSLRCDQCDASLVLHRGKQLPRGALMRCHHCLGEQLTPRACPLCGGAVVALAHGTQRVEDEIAATMGPELGLVSGETMLRVDSDTMRRGADYFAALDRFARGEVRLLLGTQMIAKGLDFPGVRLVGVINADTALHLPDFRASERTFQLVCQVAGRAGRGRDAGLVIVQTMSPTAEAIRRAAEHDYLGFAEAEMELRSKCGLPPVTRMARIVCRDEVMEKAEAAAGDIAAALTETDGGGVLTITGPMPCPISRLHGYFRFAVEVISPGAGELQRALGELRRRGLLKSDARTAVDVDPLSLL